MKTPNEKFESYLKAKAKVKQLKIFYIHLVGYIIVVMLLCYNLYIIEEVPSKNVILWLIYTTLITWSIFIITHARCVFKWRLFKKSWEERKLKEYLDKK